MSSRHLTPPPASPVAQDRERGLRAELRRPPGSCVLTGGQTGVDTQAAVAALSAGLAVHLVFPLGLLQEDGPLTPGRRRALRGATLHELPSPDFRYRTWTCAYLCDAMILIDPAGGDGCQETIRAAGQLGRPLLGLDAVAPEQLSTWLEETCPRVLMIAGCRASLLASQGKERSAELMLDALMAVVAPWLSRPAGHPSQR